MPKKEAVYNMIGNVTREAMDCNDREKVCKRKDVEELVVAASEESFDVCLSLLKNRINFHEITGEKDGQPTQELREISEQLQKHKSQLNTD